MFCFQCQETAKNQGCTVKGVCGKSGEVAVLQDLLIHTAKGVSIAAIEARKKGKKTIEADHFIVDALFMTITNANFDDQAITAKITKGLSIRDSIIKDTGLKTNTEALSWKADRIEDFIKKGQEIGVERTTNPDMRSLRELLTYGIKGMAAYAHHAMVLKYEDESIYDFMQKGLAATLDDNLSGEDLTALVLKCGEVGVTTMALLDSANTTTYGHPEITKVKTGVRQNPAILISGHDLRDMEQLLQQTDGKGIDIYTHSEMLPANSYPAFKKFKHLAGNYGNAWWKQKDEFEKFNGPILMTTNCIVPVADSYKDRIFTTGAAGYPGVKHINEDKNGNKDFSEIINLAKKLPPPTELENGEIIGGFARNTVMSVADKVIEAVKSGAIKKFIVMAGCDGRMSSRNYYTDFAKGLEKDTIILTAGCAKYKYNKLELGDIGGIPRVLDAGQCNDSYSLAYIALKLKEAFGLKDINELPIVYNIAWYEQKAVLVLLALLHLGVKKIHLGPTIPAFLSPGVLDVLVKNFGISGILSVENDLIEFMK